MLEGQFDKSSGWKPWVLWCASVAVIGGWGGYSQVVSGQTPSRAEVTVIVIGQSGKTLPFRLGIKKGTLSKCEMPATKKETLLAHRAVCEIGARVSFVAYSRATGLDTFGSIDARVSENGEVLAVWAEEWPVESDGPPRGTPSHLLFPRPWCQGPEVVWGEFTAVAFRKVRMLRIQPDCTTDLSSFPLGRHTVIVYNGALPVGIATFVKRLTSTPGYTPPTFTSIIR